MTATLPPLPDLVLALRAIAEYPVPELDNMAASNMRAIAVEALAAVPAPIVVQPGKQEALELVSRHQKACIELGGAPNFALRYECHAEMIAARKVLVAALTAPTVQPVQPTPLTDSQIDEVPYIGNLRSAGLRRFARAIEILHGISAPVVPTPTQTPKDQA